MDKTDNSIYFDTLSELNKMQLGSITLEFDTKKNSDLPGQKQIPTPVKLSLKGVRWVDLEKAVIEAAKRKISALYLRSTKERVLSLNKSYFDLFPETKPVRTTQSKRQIEYNAKISACKTFLDNGLFNKNGYDIAVSDLNKEYSDIINPAPVIEIKDISVPHEPAIIDEPDENEDEENEDKEK